MNFSAICIFLLLQTVISIKPGFVHFTNGQVNVRKFEQLVVGKKIETGSDGRVEIGLGPDSLLRLDENSVAVFDSIDKSEVAVRIESGSALVEVEKIDKPDRIHVTAGEVTTLIDSRGVFRYSTNSVSVIDGKLKIEGSSTTVQKGSRFANNGHDPAQTRLELSTPAVFKSFLNSPKAGFVNAVQGEVNVHQSDTVKSDQPVQTGPASYVELLLRPGAFMRVDENSSVIIESNTTNDVVVKVTSGSALIENVVPEERLPIRVNIGGVKSLIAMPGLYRFTSDTGRVIDGVLRIGKNGEAVFDGMEVKIVDKMYETKDVKEDDASPTGLDAWSRQRSQILAKANFRADYADSTPNFYLFLADKSFNAAWIYSPLIDGITFIPQLKRESYYGNSFVPTYPLMPGPPMLPANAVRSPRQEPNLPAVTPAPGQTPISPGPAASPTPAPAPAPSTTAPTPAPAPKSQGK
jgi:hypothetical protein